MGLMQTCGFSFLTTSKGALDWLHPMFCTLKKIYYYYYHHHHYFMCVCVRAPEDQAPSVTGVTGSCQLAWYPKFLRDTSNLNPFLGPYYRSLFSKMCIATCHQWSCLMRRKTVFISLAPFLIIWRRSPWAHRYLSTSSNMLLGFPFSNSLRYWYNKANFGRRWSRVSGKVLIRCLGNFTHTNKNSLKLTKGCWVKWPEVCSEAQTFFF